MQNLQEKDWAWIAGLIEGEGCISFTNNYPVLQLQMTDKDIVEKLSLFLECTINGPCQRKIKNSKPLYQIALRKTKKLQYISDMIYEYMGERRKKSIDNWREYWNNKYSQSKSGNADN